ncbi:MAG: dockerin type I domain-containing protein, partial [bacterium]
QLDWNEDGIADCIAFRFGDLNLDGVIGAQDLAILLANWGDQGPLLGDVNRDGTINALDLSILLGRWGQTL